MSLFKFHIFIMYFKDLIFIISLVKLLFTLIIRRLTTSGSAILHCVLYKTQIIKCSIEVFGNKN